MTDGTFKDIRRSWMSREDDARIKCYLSMDGRATVAELLDYLTEVAPARTPEEFRINFSTVTWIDAPTEAEQRARAEWNRARDERHAKWEQDTYTRLKAKFEPAAGSQVDTQ